MIFYLFLETCLLDISDLYFTFSLRIKTHFLHYHLYYHPHHQFYFILINSISHWRKIQQNSRENWSGMVNLDPFIVLVKS